MKSVVLWIMEANVIEIFIWIARKTQSVIAGKNRIMMMGNAVKFYFFIEYFFGLWFLFRALNGI
jgi:hypothetical protein